MRVAHILRKYNPAEWGGTETALKRLLDGLSAHRIEPIVYCPKRPALIDRDPLAEAGYRVERFRAFLPVWRLTEAQRRQLIAVGGNLMSFELMWKLRREPNLSIIHTHTLNRLGGIAATLARVRRLPLVVTVHGGVMDLPEVVRAKLMEPLAGGIEWGKVFGWLLRSRRVLEDADAIITCNRTEAVLLKTQFPGKIICVQPHGIDARAYDQDHRAAARQAFPEIADRRLLLIVGRIDPVKNQGWVVQQLPRVLQSVPDAHLAIVGACTDEAYGKLLKKEIRNLGLEAKVTLTGGLPPGDARLIGLFQQCDLLLNPSLSETFGLVILEGWAAGKPVLASATSGALDLVRPGENGWLFELGDVDGFHACLGEALRDPDRARQVGEAGQRRARDEYDFAVLAKRVQHLYEELIRDD